MAGIAPAPAAKATVPPEMSYNTIQTYINAVNKLMANDVPVIIPNQNLSINVTSTIINIYKKNKEAHNLGNVEHVRIHYHATKVLNELFEKYQAKMDQVYQTAAIK